MPRWARKLLELATEGELGQLAKIWDGWVVRGRHLRSPEGWSFTPGEVRAIPYMRAQISEYQLLQRSIQQADWIDQRYVVPAGEPDDSAG